MYFGNYFTKLYWPFGYILKKITGQAPRGRGANLIPF